MKHYFLIGYISRLQNSRFLFHIRTWKAPWKDLDGAVTEILACETYAPRTPVGVSPQPSSRFLHSLQTRPNTARVAGVRKSATVSQSSAFLSHDLS